MFKEDALNEVKKSKKYTGGIDTPLEELEEESEKHSFLIAKQVYNKAKFYIQVKTWIGSALFLFLLFQLCCFYSYLSSLQNMDIVTTISTTVTNRFSEQHFLIDQAIALKEKILFTRLLTMSGTIGLIIFCFKPEKSLSRTLSKSYSSNDSKETDVLLKEVLNKLEK